MSEKPRFHRPEPARTAPHRRWSGLYRGADSWGRAAAGSAPAPDPMATIAGFVGDLFTTGAKLGSMMLDSMGAAMAAAPKAGRQPSDRARPRRPGGDAE